MGSNKSTKYITKRNKSILLKCVSCKTILTFICLGIKLLPTIGLGEKDSIKKYTLFCLDDIVIGDTDCCCPLSFYCRTSCYLLYTSPRFFPKAFPRINCSTLEQIILLLSSGEPMLLKRMHVGDKGVIALHHSHIFTSVIGHSCDLPVITCLQFRQSSSMKSQFFGSGGCIVL